MYIEINIFNVLIFIIILCVFICFYNYLLDNFIYLYNGKIHIDKLKYNDNNNIKNKRIAICISGQIRDGYKECLSLFNLFLKKKYDSDIFCCFEDCDDKIKQDINTLISPKKIKFVQNYEENNKISVGTMSMYNKIFLANELKKEYEIENNFTYDFVIRIRPDLIIKEYLPDYIFDNMDDKIYFPFISNIFGYFGYPDFLAIGNSRIMDIYSNIFLYLKNEEIICNISETLLYNYLKIKKIKCEIINYPIQLYRFRYDNLGNIFESIKYIYSLKDRYIFDNKCKYVN